MDNACIWSNINEAKKTRRDLKEKNWYIVYKKKNMAWRAGVLLDSLV